MDLRLGWDLGDPEQQKQAEARLDAENPYLLILSPMCLAFSQLLNLNTNPETLKELKEWGREHLRFACHLAKRQLLRGGRVLFEQPWGATSWDEECVKEIWRWEGMRRVRCDQCLFGQVSVDRRGHVGPARKATGFLTNDECIAEVLNRRCYGGHEHIQLLGGRAKACERYPPRLVSAILRALRRSMQLAGCGCAEGLVGHPFEPTISAIESGPVLEEPELLARPATTVEEQIIRDRCTGLPLDPVRVQAARAEEMSFMDELKVLLLSDWETCIHETGRPPIPTDWVDIDKGDPAHPCYRSRLVAQETRRRSTIDIDDWAATFAATPPYEAFRLQLSLLMTGARPENASDEVVMMLLDISRAHLHSPLLRVVFVIIDGQVYRLLKALYGLRDAGASFDRKVLEVMAAMGVQLGKFSICVGHRGQGSELVRLVRHGDDFSVTARRKEAEKFRDELAKHLMVKVTAILGPNSELGDVNECIHLNRLIRWFAAGSAGGERIELEADPRHGEILIQQMGLDDERAKPVSTPGVKPTADEDEGKELTAEERYSYRSWAMRASYLAQDRCELQFACKEAARRMQEPHTADLRALKRIARFLKGHPRCIIVYARQSETYLLDVYSDSDWAGCRRTRRSTSSSYMMNGKHLILSSSTTQNVIATSSGEAEFYALTKSASRAIGGCAMAADLCREMKPRVFVDATASKGIASRRGVGKVRHLHTQVLWVQEAVMTRQLHIEKLPGKENPSDMGTKHLAQKEMNECLQRAGCILTGGRSRLAKRVATDGAA